MPKILTPNDLYTSELYQRYAGYFSVPTRFLDMQANMDTRHQIPQGEDADFFWRLRELMRIHWDAGKRLYTLLPNYGYIAELAEGAYFARMAEDGKQIAFTPSAEFGLQDRQMTMKLGRFLSRFLVLHHEELRDNELVKAIVAEWNFYTTPPELHMTADPHEIATIYREGPSSCMGQKAFQMEHHPCEAYGGPDTVLAYIQDPSGRITARTIVRTDREPNQYIRIYGDTARMMMALQAHGITHSSDGLEGARIRKLPVVNLVEGFKPTVIAAPYLDGGRNHGFDDPDDPELVRICSEHDRRWRWTFKQTAGTSTHRQAKRCRHCRKPYLVEDMYDVDHGASQICLPCLIEHDTQLVLQLWEVKTAEGRTALVSSDNRFRYAEYRGVLYDQRYLDEYDLILVDGVVCDEHDGRLVRCIATGQLRLRDNCLQINDDFYSQMDESLGSKYPQFTLGRLLDSPEDSDDEPLGVIYNRLVKEFGCPLTRAEIRANTHPNIHPGLVKMMVQSSERGFTFSPVHELRSHRRA